MVRAQEHLAIEAKRMKEATEVLLDSDRAITSRHMDTALLLSRLRS